MKGTNEGMSEILSKILVLDIPDRNSHIHFMETLHSLLRHVAGTELPMEEDLRIHEQTMHLLPDSEASWNYTAAHYHSAKYVQASIRGFLIREKMTQQIQRQNYEAFRKLRDEFRSSKY